MASSPARCRSPRGDGATSPPPRSRIGRRSERRHRHFGPTLPPTITSRSGDALSTSAKPLIAPPPGSTIGPSGGGGIARRGPRRTSLFHKPTLDRRRDDRPRGTPGGTERDARAPAGRAGSFTKGKNLAGAARLRESSQARGRRRPRRAGAGPGRKPDARPEVHGGMVAAIGGGAAAGGSAPGRMKPRRGAALRMPVTRRRRERIPGTGSLGDEAAGRPPIGWLGRRLSRSRRRPNVVEVSALRKEGATDREE